MNSIAQAEEPRPIVAVPPAERLEASSAAVRPRLDPGRLRELFRRSEIALAAAYEGHDRACIRGDLIR
jgi:hypothetical protein